MPPDARPELASLVLHVDGAAAHATLLDRHGAASAGWLQAEALHAARAACAELEPRRWRPAAEPAVPLSVCQARWRRAEAEAARALAAALLGAGLRPPPRGAGPGALVVEELGGSLGLPWELLRELPAAEAFGGWEVLRRAPSAPVAAPRVEEALGVEVRLYAPDPDDPVIEPLLAGLRGVLADLPGVHLSGGRGDAPWQPGLLRVLHVCAHGRWAGEGVGVSLSAAGGGGLGPGELARDIASGAAPEVVLLDVCGAAGEDAEALHLPAPRLALDGVPVTLAWRTRAPGAAALGFARRFYERLAHGAGLQAAWTGGLLGQGEGVTPGEWGWTRPWLRRVWLASTERWALASAPRTRLPLGLRPAGPREAEVLDAALAAAAGGGFLGLEHLVAALLDHARERAGARVAADPALSFLLHLDAALAPDAAALVYTGWFEHPFRQATAPMELSPAWRELVAAAPGPLSLRALTRATFTHPTVAWLLDVTGLPGLHGFGDFRLPPLRNPVPAAGPETEGGPRTEGPLSEHLLSVEALLGPFVEPARVVDEGLHLLLLNGPTGGARVTIPAGAGFGRVPTADGQIGLFPREGPFATSVSRRLGLHLGHGRVQVEASRVTLLRPGGGAWVTQAGTEHWAPGDLLAFGARLRARVEWSGDGR